MSKQPEKRSHEYRFWLAANDEIGINQHLTDNIEIKNEKHEEGPGELRLWVKAEAVTAKSAFEKAMLYLDEFFDVYCVMKNVPLSVHGSDQIDLLEPELSSKHWPHYGSIHYKPYSLTKKEAEIIYSHIVKLRESRYRFLTLALKFYRKAKLQEELSDKLISYFISLESLFTDESTEITFRFSRRMAILLGKTSQQRKKLVEMGKKMYKLRSKVVHGNESKIEQKSLIVIDIWVRNSILSFILLMEHHKNREKILLELDDAMMDEKIRIRLQKQSKPKIELRSS
ncbi:MAG: hypothetical protein WAL88_01710 [Nitrosotalea sp.]